MKKSNNTEVISENLKAIRSRERIHRRYAKAITIAAFWIGLGIALT